MSKVLEPSLETPLEIAEHKDTAMSEKCLPNGWQRLLEDELNSPSFRKLRAFLKSELSARKQLCPPMGRVMQVFADMPLEDIKVVILGQDPYHGPGQAIGRSFAVPNDLMPKPPSLKNIFKEIAADTGAQISPEYSDLTGWAAQGVFMLNSVLTVEARKAFSHRGKGWEEFTDAVIRKIAAREKGVVFLLWGAAAHAKAQLIAGKQHFVLKAPHPSPLSAHRGFFGCKHFSKANQILQEQLGSKPVDWARVIEPAIRAKSASWIGPGT